MSPRDESIAAVASAGWLLTAALLAAHCDSSRPVALSDRGVGDQRADQITCSSGTLCGGECVDILSDLRHCGGCGRVCDAKRAGGDSPICDLGRCVQGDICPCDTALGFACVAGKCACVGNHQTNCGGKCVDTANDVANCGSCGTTCGGAPCHYGQCLDCPGLTLCFGACVELKSDSNNCGQCGIKCDTVVAGSSCVLGKCACIAGLTECGGKCVNTSYDVNNCGGCGTACPTGKTCNAGNCYCGCPTGQTCCGPVCVSLQSDNNNCGACGNTCAADMACSSGKCICAAKTDCSGTCVDLKTDPSHCGACGIACTPPQTCQSGWCTPCPPCPASQSCCGAACVDTSTSLGHCGQCGNACSSVGANTCAGGACCVHLEAEDSSQVTATPTGGWPDGWTKASSGMHHSSSTGPATLSFLLKGTRLAVGYFKAPAFGSFQVAIDGDTPVAINGGAGGTGSASSVVATSLLDTVHSVVVTCPAQTTCFLDYFTSCN